MQNFSDLVQGEHFQKMGLNGGGRKMCFQRKTGQYRGKRKWREIGPRLLLGLITNKKWHSPFR